MNRERGKEERGGEEKLKSSASHQQAKWSVQTGSLNKIIQTVILSGTVKGRSYCNLQIWSRAGLSSTFWPPTPTPGCTKGLGLTCRKRAETFLKEQLKDKLRERGEANTSHHELTYPFVSSPSGENSSFVFSSGPYSKGKFCSEAWNRKQEVNRTDFPNSSNVNHCICYG